MQMQCGCRSSPVGTFGAVTPLFPKLGSAFGASLNPLKLPAKSSWTVVVGEEVIRLQLLTIMDCNGMACLGKKLM